MIGKSSPQDWGRGDFVSLPLFLKDLAHKGDTFNLFLLPFENHLVLKSGHELANVNAAISYRLVIRTSGGDSNEELEDLELQEQGPRRGILSLRRRDRAQLLLRSKADPRANPTEG